MREDTAACGHVLPFYELESFRTFIERRADEAVVAEATVKVVVGGDRMVSTGEGDGPVNALDRALRAALTPHYPRIVELRLTDFRVRVLDSAENAARAHRAGLRRLVTLQLPKEVRALRRGLGDLTHIRLWYAKAGEAPAGLPIDIHATLDDELVALIVDRAFLEGRDPPRDPAAFRACVDSGLARLERVAPMRR